MITTIQLRMETKRKLGALGNKGDTYEDIIVKLIKRGIKNENKRRI